MIAIQVVVSSELRRLETKRLMHMTHSDPYHANVRPVRSESSDVGHDPYYIIGSARSCYCKCILETWESDVRRSYMSFQWSVFPGNADHPNDYVVEDGCPPWLTHEQYGALRFLLL